MGILWGGNGDGDTVGGGWGGGAIGIRWGWGGMGCGAHLWGGHSMGCPPPIGCLTIPPPIGWMGRTRPMRAAWSTNGICAATASWGT